MQTDDDKREGRAWAAWLVVVVLFTSLSITLSIDAILEPHHGHAVTGRVTMQAVAALLAVTGFVQLARGSSRFPDPRIRNVTRAIVHGCTFAWVCFLAVAVAHQV